MTKGLASFQVEEIAHSVEKKATLDEAKVVAIANDLAKRLKSTEEVLRDHGVSAHQHYELEQNPFFQNALAAATLDWNGPLNTVQRCTLGAQALTEKLLPEIAKAAEDPKQPLNARTDAARFVASVAGFNKKEQAHDDTERVRITINLGADAKLKYEQPVKPIEPKTIEHDVS